MDRADKFIIAELFGDIFGIQSPIYIPWGQREAYRSDRFSGIEYLTEEQSKVVSALGTPVMGSFVLSGDTYKTYDNKGMLSDLKMNDFVMPYATLCEFSRNMNVTKTKAIGTAGTVKEIYGLDDWSISIRGFCITDNTRNNQKTAQEQMLELIKWRDVTDTVNVIGSIFHEKKIYGFTIDSFSIKPQDGGNVIAYEISATSDNVIELML